MGMSLNIPGGLPRANADHADRAEQLAKTRHQEEAAHGSQQVAKTRQSTAKSVQAQRDSFQKTHAAAQYARLEQGRQSEATQENRSAHAAETPNPETALPKTQENTQPHPDVNAQQPIHETAVENPTPTQEAAAPETQASENLPQVETAGQPAGETEAPVVPHEVAHTQESPHTQNNPQQGQGESGANTQAARNTRPTPESHEPTTSTPRAPSDESLLPPDQQLKLQYARLQGGGQVQARAQTTTPQTPGTLVAQGSMTPTAPAPQTNAEHSLPQGAMKVFENGDIPADHADSYAAGLKAAIVLRQTEASRPEGAGSAPMLNAAASFLAAAPMTREQMLMARLNRDNNRGSDREERSVGGLPPRDDSDLGLRYQLGARRDMGAA